jgi:CRP/FNR family transcriptional regulator, cyclic AMP receptor protein
MFENCLHCRASKAGWFCHLAPQALEEYAGLSTHVMLPAGVVLFTEDEAALNVSVICDGRIKLTKSSRNGKTLLVKIAKPGEVLGLSAVLSKTRYEVTAQAIEPTQVKTFRQNDFLRFIQGYVEGSLHAAESLSNEYRSVLSDASRLALSPSIAGRVAHLVLELAIENQTAQDAKPQIRMLLKREELAAKLGSSRESISRVLSDFSRQGILSLEGATMTILRKESLEALL